MTAIALVSDIHGNLAALEAVAADIASRGITRVLNLGDSLSGPLLPLETARFLMATGWLSIAGNHERQLLELQPGAGGASDTYAAAQLDAAAFDWIRGLPATARVDDVFLCHGTPTSDCRPLLETLAHGRLHLASAIDIDARLGGERAAVVSCGHTHLPRMARSAAGKLLVNPGSVGLQAYTDDQPSHYVVENGAPDARYAILHAGPTGWSVEHVAVPYDHASMVVLAQARGFDEWAHALMTGYVAR